LEAKGSLETTSIRVLTDISTHNLVNGSTDAEAILFLMERVQNVELT